MAQWRKFLHVIEQKQNTLIKIHMCPKCHNSQNSNLAPENDNLVLYKDSLHIGAHSNHRKWFRQRLKVCMGIVTKYMGKRIRFTFLSPGGAVISNVPGNPMSRERLFGAMSCIWLEQLAADKWSKRGGKATGIH